MSDDSEEPEGKTWEARLVKIKAEDNPWYLLATLYGVPGETDWELKNKNRRAWNRYFATDLDEETRTKLIEEERHPALELRPFSQEELQEVATAFAERCKASAKELALPASGARIDFAYVEFEQGACFVGYLLSSVSFFQRAAFSRWADFDRATFSSWVDFGGATFSARASFIGAIFPGGTHFGDAIFSGGASFIGATFSGGAIFSGAAFSGGAIFNGATFSRGAFFSGATFSSAASFAIATFGRITNFVNAELQGETSFEGVTFRTEPPKFFGAKLHQGTVWRDIKDWPKPKGEEQAGRFIDAYACLKLEMDRLEKHEDELDFFALELQSRRVWLGTWAGLPIAIYGAFSDFGRSYLRPLVALFYLGLIGTLAFLPSDSLSPWQSLGLSAANTLNVFGFRKDFFDARMIECLPAGLKVVAAVQTILGTILLFLFGLGIRNKFRMK